MVKRVLGLLMALCVMFTVLPTAVFAIDEEGEIKTAMKAIKDGIGTMGIYNDMTADEFLSAAKKILPDGSTVELGFSKETDYRIYNATSEKDGSIFVNILFTCGPYTRHEMYDAKIPKLTGDAAAANADKENLAKDIAAAKAIFQNVSLDPDVTAEDILESVKKVITNGSTVELTGEFEKVDSTATKKGSAKCFIKFTLGNETDTMRVYNTLRLLETTDETNNKDADKEDSKTTDENTETKTEINFADVADDAYYASAVKWAVGKNITQGTSETTFSPDLTCTRAQILTFLWRAVGSPKAEIENPFTDISASDYFYDAAIWAYGKGMVSGDKFEGNTPCTRASTVEYLWKNAGSPSLGKFGEFEDVDEDADYADAVDWAVAAEVTSGVSKTEFAPENTCTRGQIVTFLSRALED